MSSTLTRAFVISLLAHVAGVATVELGHKLGFWDRSFVTAILKSDVLNQVVKTARERAEMQRRQQEQQPPEAELIFVDVDPTQALPEPPKDAKYYSSHNTAAANVTKTEEKNVPKIDGTQEKVIKTADVLRPDPRGLQPTPPEKAVAKAETPKPEPKPPKPVEPTPPQPQPLPQRTLEPKPESTEKGETLMAKVLPREELRPQPQPDNPTPEQPPKRSKPSSLAEAYAKHGLTGQKMRQQGGVGRIASTEGLDVKATPFGTYDAMFIEAVQARWFSLLQDRDFIGNQSGQVVVEFHLHQDGRITDLSILNSSVNEMLSWFCQRAVLDPAPYQKFPPDLRRTMDKDYREIRFTFYYNQ